MRNRSAVMPIVLGLMGLGLLCGALVGIDMGIKALALRPVAEQLGVSPTKLAITDYVTALLENHKDASQAEIHQLLDAIGKFKYTETTRIKIGEAQFDESAYWTMAKLPVGQIWAVWILRYDANLRLVDVAVGESP
jgi:hypothetical protein